MKKTQEKEKVTDKDETLSLYRLLTQKQACEKFTMEEKLRAFRLALEKPELLERWFVALVVCALDGKPTPLVNVIFWGCQWFDDSEDFQVVCKLIAAAGLVKSVDAAALTVTFDLDLIKSMKEGVAVQELLKAHPELIDEVRNPKHSDRATALFTLRAPVILSCLQPQVS